MEHIKLISFFRLSYLKSKALRQNHKLKETFIRLHYRVRDLLSKQNSRCLLVEETNCIKQVGLPTDKEFSGTAVPTYRSLRVSNSSLVHGLSNSPICNTKVFEAFCIVMESLCFATASANSSLLQASVSCRCKPFDVHKPPLYVINFNNILLTYTCTS